MSVEKMREQFEAWCKSRGLEGALITQMEFDSLNDSYDHWILTATWQAWQAALAVSPKPDPVELTDEELLQIHASAIRKTENWHVLAGLRAVIAADRAKRSAPC